MAVVCRPAGLPAERARVALVPSTKSCWPPVAAAEAGTGASHTSEPAAAGVKPPTLTAPFSTGCWSRTGR